MSNRIVRRIDMPRHLWYAMQLKQSIVIISRVTDKVIQTIVPLKSWGDNWGWNFDSNGNIYLVQIKETSMTIGDRIRKGYQSIDSDLKSLPNDSIAVKRLRNAHSQT